MAMLIAWHVTNKATYPQDKRFSKNVFVVAPGLTVRSRLSVLIPDSEGNYYDLFNIVPQERRAGCAGHIGDPASHRPAPAGPTLLPVIGRHSRPYVATFALPNRGSGGCPCHGRRGGRGTARGGRGRCRG